VTYSVKEIFKTLQGEGGQAGRAAVFCRFAGCNLWTGREQDRANAVCQFCDTDFVGTDGTGGGRFASPEALADAIEAAWDGQRDLRFVVFTGGEPLLQKDAWEFVERLLAGGYSVLIETSGMLLETGGHRSIERVPDAVVAIMDVKCPGSGETHRMDWANLERLRPHDEVKFVIQDRADFDYAVDVLRRYDLHTRVRGVLFSPVFGRLNPAELSRWILESGLPVRLQIQMHKYIWDPAARGV